MSTLKLARRSLLASLALYGAMLFLVWLPAGSGELWFWIALLAVFGMALSATICIALQARAALQKRAKPKTSGKP